MSEVFSISTCSLNGTRFTGPSRDRRQFRREPAASRATVAQGVHQRQVAKALRAMGYDENGDPLNPEEKTFKAG